MDSPVHVADNASGFCLDSTTHVAPTVCDSEDHGTVNTIVQYLLREVPEFRRLSDLRERGWKNPKGDRFFEKQRQNADHPDRKTAKYFYRMMKDIGHDMHQLTDVFRVRTAGPDPPCILDMCMAPGGLLAIALRVNPGAQATGFSLPRRKGGHEVLIPDRSRLSLKFLDITLLAADMGRLDIPTDHPDAANFLPRQLTAGQRFDLVICDGQVLRSHERETYRENREASRLALTQLALGLEHLKPGGSLIMLLHKVEALNTVRLIYSFSSFSSVRLYKHVRFHAKRSSFYMLATNVRSDCEEAALAVKEWKEIWDIATFGTDKMYRQARQERGLHSNLIVQVFGPRLGMMGRHVWEIQADALAKAPFLR